MNCSISSYSDPVSPYDLLFRSLLLIPISHYLVGLVVFLIVFLYNFLECHLIGDALGRFRGQPVTLTFNPNSEIYHGVASKCKLLHQRYLATPWLTSPHLQTTFLNFFGRPPVFRYRRKIFRTADDGTIALDWLLHSDVVKGDVCMSNDIPKDDRTPIVIVIPGLSSDSNSPYLKHLVYNMAKSGWDVVVTNHRGLGGITVTDEIKGNEIEKISFPLSSFRFLNLSQTGPNQIRLCLASCESDCFYNAGWTEDIRAIIHHLHSEYPAAPLYVVGTSIGANVLVKYLGEDGGSVPIAGAVAICSPWDLLIGDRFIGRRLVQKFYDRALTVGLQGYAELHHPYFSRLTNWEGIKKSRRIREFDNHATIIVGKYETVDTFYRRCSSANFVGNVCVPLLCISSLDDPLCTKEAIPWDECRLNKNIVLATTQHGGHLAFFEGISASSLWWVRAVNEFLSVLSSSPYTHKQQPPMKTTPTSSIDHSPFLSITQGGGMVSPVWNEQPTDTDPTKETHEAQHKELASAKHALTVPETNSIKRHLDRLSRVSRRSLWVMVYISIASSWPLMGYALYFFFKRKINGGRR